MNGKVDTFLWAVAIGVLLISLANPGGFIIAGIIAFVILGGRYGLPFVGDLMKQRQSGVGRAKASQKFRDGLRQDGNRRDRK
jgi:hypothetical protein